MNLLLHRLSPLIVLTLSAGAFGQTGSLHSVSVRSTSLVGLYRGVTRTPRKALPSDPTAVVTRALTCASTGCFAALPSDPTAVVTTPRLRYRLRTLPNGLTVCSVENHKSPTAAIQVWCRVDGKNDPENKSGFAHLFEHLMFKAALDLNRGDLRKP